MLVSFESSTDPLSLRGPTVVDRDGVPRFYASVWSALLPGNLASSTLVLKLRDLDRFYRFADELTGSGGKLDDALGGADTEAIARFLEGYYFWLKDTSQGSSGNRKWQAALTFVKEILTRITQAAETRAALHNLEAKLARLETLYAPLNLRRRRSPEPIRSLPASVIQAVYEMLDPTSIINPFRDSKIRWRGYVAFLMLLHLGLRRAELLLLPVDAIKTAVDRDSHRTIRWINVRTNEDEDDPRYSCRQSSENVVF